jgi:sugar phosphate isomerase/epimerase
VPSPGGHARPPQGHGGRRRPVALAGVLDSRSFADPARRGWVFRSAGSVHDRDWWAEFVDALREVGYDDALSIENEDASLPPEASVEAAARFIRPLLEG